MDRLNLLAWAVLAVLAASPAWAHNGEAARPQARAEVERLINVLPAGRLAELGLAGANKHNISLAAPMPVYTVSRADLAQTEGKAWGGLFKEIDRIFFPVRVEGEERAGVWLARRDGGFTVIGVGDKELARAAAEARAKIGPALAERGLLDQYEVRLLVLDWAACRMLAVLVRDRLLIWPLPSGLALMGLKPGLYDSGEIASILSGRSPAQ